MVLLFVRDPFPSVPYASITNAGSMINNQKRERRAVLSEGFGHQEGKYALIETEPTVVALVPFRTPFLSLPILRFDKFYKV